MAGKLTARGVESLAKRKGRYGDGDGLFLRVLDPGKRVYWTFRYRANGHDREMSVGPYPELSLAEARARHVALRKAVVTDKIDPIGDRRAAKSMSMLAQVSAKPTFGVMAIDHVETHECGWRSAKYARQWRQTLTQFCQPIWLTPVDLVDTQAVLACLKPIWNAKPVTATRLRGRVEVVLDAAQALGHIHGDKANPARWRGHLQRLLPKPAKLARGHHPAMPHKAVPAFVARLRASDNLSALALEFVILTATRTSETLGMQWREVDLERAIWTVPPGRMKTNEAHSIPLSDRALDILAEARQHAGKEPEPESFVFFGVRPKKPLSSMSMSMLLRRMGVDATVHGMRSSFRMWCSDVAHVEFEIAEACLSHRVGSAVSRAYARSDMLERRRPIMSAWADFVTGKTNDNVIELRRAGA
jgi:integrase